MNTFSSRETRGFDAVEHRCETIKRAGHECHFDTLFRERRGEKTTTGKPIYRSTVQGNEFPTTSNYNYLRKVPCEPKCLSGPEYISTRNFPGATIRDRIISQLRGYLKQAVEWSAMKQREKKKVSDPNLSVSKRECLIRVAFTGFDGYIAIQIMFMR